MRAREQQRWVSAQKCASPIPSQLRDWTCFEVPDLVKGGLGGTIPSSLLAQLNNPGRSRALGTAGYMAPSRCPVIVQLHVTDHSMGKQRRDVNLSSPNHVLVRL